MHYRVVPPPKNVKKKKRKKELAYMIQSTWLVENMWLFSFLSIILGVKRRHIGCKANYSMIFSGERTSSCPCLIPLFNKYLWNCHIIQLITFTYHFLCKLDFIFLHHLPSCTQHQLHLNYSSHYFLTMSASSLLQEQVLLLTLPSPPFCCLKFDYSSSLDSNFISP